MIPLLLDAGLPRGASAELRALGWDVVHVHDIGLGAATDGEVIGAASREGRVVVSLDGDMPRLLHLTGAREPSVVHFRIQGLDRPAAVEAIPRIVLLCEDDLRAGAIVSVDHDRARVRRLPIG